MNKTLLLMAHPSQNSLSGSLAEILKKFDQQLGQNVEQINTQTLPRITRHLAQEGFSCLYNDLADSIDTANQIIFVTPIWWWAFPSGLKDFLDGALQNRRHFEFVPHPILPHIHVPKGKIKDPKKILIITTSGAPGWVFYWKIMPNIAAQIISKSFRLCGVKRRNIFCYHLGSANTTPKERFDTFVKKIKKSAFFA